MRNKVLGVFLVLITIPFIILSILTLTFSNLRKPLFYKTTFNKYNLYKPATLAIRSLSVSNDNKNFFSAVIPQITESWLKENTETNLDNYQRYLKGQDANFNFYLNIAPFKDDIAKNIQGLSKEDIPDKLTFASYSEILVKLQAAQAEMAKQSGQSVEDQKAQTASIENKFNQNTAHSKKILGYFNIGSYILFAITLLLLILIALAARRNLKSMFRWLAATLLISVGLMILPALFVNRCNYSKINIPSEKITTQTKTLIQEATKAMAIELTRTLLLLCAITGGVGILLLILSFIVPGGKVEPAKPEKAPAPKIVEVRDVS